MKNIFRINKTKESSNRWKEKVKEKSKFIKFLKKKIKDAVKSRDKWKQDAHHYKRLYEEEKKKLK